MQVIYLSLLMMIVISTAAISDDSLYENCTGIVATVANAVCDIGNNVEVRESVELPFA